MNLSDLTNAVTARFGSEAANWGLDSGDITARYITNLGGFVNHSFHVQDDSTALHVKLANRTNVARLRRWVTHGDLLTRQYHAPPIAGWIEFPEFKLAGMVFEHVPGVVPVTWDETSVRTIGRILSDLHGNDALAAQLGTPGPCANTFLETYADRFREDLREIEPYLPPFLTASTYRFLNREAQAIEETVRTSGAFAVTEGAPIHTDIWLNNILIGPDRLYVLDWDDLCTGDPAIDIGMLGGPFPGDWNRRITPPGIPPNDAFEERVRLYHRAILLDWCIDVVADYCEGARWLDDPNEYQREKQTHHEDALDAYQDLYGSCDET